MIKSLVKKLSDRQVETHEKVKLKIFIKFANISDTFKYVFVYVLVFN